MGLAGDLVCESGGSAEGQLGGHLQRFSGSQLVLVLLWLV
jgi:hypothetical protein